MQPQQIARFRALSDLLSLIAFVSGVVVVALVAVVVEGHSPWKAWEQDHGPWVLYGHARVCCCCTPSLC